MKMPHFPPVAFNVFALTTGLMLAAGSISSAVADTVKDREGALRADKSKLEKDPRWHYNDPDSGFKLAAATGKPLLVVVRCVPCLACAGIDADVLEEKELAPLLDLFVCVRVINANTLDLSRFQFDYDLSFSAMMFNGDGTVYGRFGSWSHQKDPLNKTTAGFRKALEAALTLHASYPGNKEILAGKQGIAPAYRTPVEFPALSGTYGDTLDWDGKLVASCVHCHMVGNAFRTSFRDAGKAVPAEWIYPHPSPQTVGALLAADDIARIESIEPDSAAAEAGLLPGDRLLVFNGQPLVSTADVSWILHRAPESGPLPLTVDRAGQKVELTLALAKGWRSQSDISRRAGTWSMRAMALGGLQLEELSAVDRARSLLGSGTMALRVKHAGQYGPHAAAKNAGFQVGDILTEVDSIKEHLTEGDLIGRLLSAHRRGDRIDCRVIRGTGTLTLQLPQQ
ncbi:MAG: hypothetical protein JWL81_2617 [Verrucomicrobiales bacterium]|nr:hypothetical protein [Verrucomicrobiales bacterium]